jgi:hypothetical protein
VAATIRSLLRDKFNRESQAAAAKISEMVDGRAAAFAGKQGAARMQ